MVYNVPPSVSVVLAERSTKLRDQKFPQPFGSNLADLIDEVIAAPSVADRFLLDLAIVTTRHAHAFDVDENGDFFFQPAFREAKYLEESTLYRRNIMRKRIKLLASITDSDRHLDQQERAIFTKMHTNCRRVSGKDPLLQGAEMNQFLDMVTVRTLDMNVAKVGFHGISSYDGTVVYVATEGADSITVPHEMEHNIRRYVEPDPVVQARLVSPQRDKTLEIDGVQCESGFVSEHRFHQNYPEELPSTVPAELISPFSARWNRRAFR